MRSGMCYSCIRDRSKTNTNKSLFSFHFSVLNGVRLARKVLSYIRGCVLRICIVSQRSSAALSLLLVLYKKQVFVYWYYCTD